MSTLNLPFGVYISTSDFLDAKYEVDDISARDSLITNFLVKLGAVIYIKDANKRYWLQAYPTPGSIIGAVWEEIGVGGELYQYPKLSNYISSIFDIYELGTLIDTISGSPYSVSYSISNFDNIKPASNVVGSSSRPELTITPETALENGTIDLNIDNLILDVVENITSTLTATNSNDETFSISNYIRARRYFYYHQGDEATAPTTSANIRALPTKEFLGLGDGGKFSIDVSKNSQVVSIYLPVGKTFNCIDEDNSYFDITDDFTLSNVTIDHGNGVTSDYNIFTHLIGYGTPPSTHDTVYTFTILDGDYIIYSALQRNQLIIDDVVEEGHQILYIPDNEVQVLTSYPTHGDLTDVVWTPISDVSNDTEVFTIMSMVNLTTEWEAVITHSLDSSDLFISVTKDNEKINVGEQIIDNNTLRIITNQDISPFKVMIGI